VGLISSRVASWERQTLGVCSRIGAP